MVEKILPNGLKVLLLEDHRSPTMTFQVWYKVGSRSERTGITGLSHMLEHMMFKGTTTRGPAEYSATIERLGGNENAFTSRDYTTYFVNIVSSKIDTVLDLEADRMANLRLDPQEFLSERQVVAEERRTRTDDDPQGALSEELYAMAFKVHPYHWPVIGWMNDIQHYTVEQLRAHYQTYYRPNNAVVIAVGDFNPSELMEKIEAAFGPIPAGPPPPPVTGVEPPQRGERRFVLKKEAQAPYVFFGYQAPNYRSKDTYALEALSVILSEGRSSRLYRELVYSQQIALDAGGDYTMLAADPDLFFFYSSVVPGKTSEEVERALLVEVERLKREPVTETELARAKNQLEAQFLMGQDSIFRQAMTLGRFELAGGWRTRDQYLPGIRAVTREDLQRVARTYFDPDNRTVGVLVPVKPERPQ